MIPIYVIIFIYLFLLICFLAVLGLRCCAQASLVAMHELLIVLAPLAVEHELSSANTAGVACGLNCPVA